MGGGREYPNAGAALSGLAPAGDAPLSFAVIGVGRLGCALATGLARRGWRLAGVHDVDPGALQAALAGAESGERLSPEACLRQADLTFLTTPDGIIPRMARKLAGAASRLSGGVLHCSGALEEEALAPLRGRGASVGVCHPLAAVPPGPAGSAALEGALFGLAGDPPAVALGRRVVTAFQGRVLPLEGADRRRYHAACVAASNLLVALLLTAEDWLDQALGEDAKATKESVPSVGTRLLPLALGALRASGAGAAGITGPVARGDAGTLRGHLEALQGGDAELYRRLSRRLLQEVGPRLPEATRRELEGLL